MSWPTAPLSSARSRKCLSVYRDHAGTLPNLGIDLLYLAIPPSSTWKASWPSTIPGRRLSSPSVVHPVCGIGLQTLTSSTLPMPTAMVAMPTMDSKNPGNRSRPMLSAIWRAHSQPTRTTPWSSRAILLVLPWARLQPWSSDRLGMISKHVTENLACTEH